MSLFWAALSVNEQRSTPGIMAPDSCKTCFNSLHISYLVPNTARAATAGHVLRTKHVACVMFLHGIPPRYASPLLVLRLATFLVALLALRVNTYLVV